MVEDEKYKYENNVLYLKNPKGYIEELFTVVKIGRKEATKIHRELMRN